MIRRAPHAPQQLPLFMVHVDTAALRAAYQRSSLPQLGITFDQALAIPALRAVLEMGASRVITHGRLH